VSVVDSQQILHRVASRKRIRVLQAGLLDAEADLVMAEIASPGLGIVHKLVPVFPGRQGERGSELVDDSQKSVDDLLMIIRRDLERNGACLTHS
jgi:hypothetical protein